MRTLLCIAVFFSALPSQAAQPEKPIPILLDTDIGDDIDDAFAVALALRSPELEVRGITTAYGDAHTRANIVCRWLHTLGKDDIPVAAGTTARATPVFEGQMQYGLRPSFRLRPQPELAAEFLYKQLKARPGELTLVPVGPLTNIAQLFSKHPECKPWIKRLVLMGGSVRVGYDGKPQPQPEWNIKADIPSAQAVFASGVPLTVAPLDATGILKLDKSGRERLFRSRAPLNQGLCALYQLWQNTDPVLYDPVAVTLCFTERFCKMEELHLTVDDKGMTRIGTGKPNARVATSIQREAFLEWCVARLEGADKDATPHKIPRTNLAKLVPRGNLPQRVHVIEDYETDIERRWWLAGKAETKNVPPGSKRACRGVWTNDFDDLMGNPKAQYTAVVFNPVPGPPMGGNTRLSVRYWLKGTGALRVQIYTLSKGYHRHLTLTDLAQEKWTDAAVDMTQARRPDGSGGPLAEDERIDDIQFYTDADAELFIDDIVLYEAAAAGEKRPFPARPTFTAWFDTGKQGKEWPGTFEIVAKTKPETWKAAKSVPTEDGEGAWIRLSLRGNRPVPEQPTLRFRYHLTGAGAFTVKVLHSSGKTATKFHTIFADREKWSEANMPVVGLDAGSAIDTVIFEAPRGATLLVDDVLLYGDKQ